MWNGGPPPDLLVSKLGRVGLTGAEVRIPSSVLRSPPLRPSALSLALSPWHIEPCRESPLSTIFRWNSAAPPEILPPNPARPAP